MSGQAPDAKAWADYHARQEAARRWAQSQAAPASAPAQRVLPPPVGPGLAGAQAAVAAQAQTANEQAWHHYHQQQAAAANAEAWRQYYAANPQAAANAVGVPGHAHQPHYGIGGHPGSTTYLPRRAPGGPYGAQHGAHHGPVSHHHARAGVTLAKNPPIVGSASAPTQTQWPPALKAYVERCFESANRSNEPSRQTVTDALKRDIEDATRAGALWTTDWDARAPPLSVPGAGAASAAAPSATFARENAAGPGPGPGPGPSPTAGPKKVYGRPRGYATFLLPEEEVSGDEAAQRSGGEKRKNARVEKKTQKTKKKKTSDRERDRDVRLPNRDDGSSGTRFFSLEDDAELEKRARRVGRFGDGTAEGASEAATAAAEARRARLSNLRFASSSPSLLVAPDATLRAAASFDDLETKETAWDAFTVRGTCERLEKSYFRLTSAPDPGTVRPEAVLRAALRRLRSREVAGDANKYTYHYLNDQLKAIRQDLVVQRLRTPFAVEAYEHHARVALRHGDLGEFNQCQTVLRDLRRDARGGRCDETTTKKKKTRRSIDDGDSKPSTGRLDDNSAEFLAYSVLYGAVTDATGPEYVAVLAEAAAFHAKHHERVTEKRKSASGRGARHPHYACVAHALAARRALAASDACEWFRLLGAARASAARAETRSETRSADDEALSATDCRENASLMRVRTEEMRFRHALAASAAFRPRVPVRFLAKTMGFSLEFPGTAPGDGGDGGDGDGDGDVAVPGDVVVPGDGAPRVALPAARRRSAAESACAAWLTRHGAALVVEDGETQMDGKASAHALFVPEDTDAVAHGDRTLDIEDFLAKATGT